jgi:hypothetical protein
VLVAASVALLVLTPWLAPRLREDTAEA